MTLQLYWPIKKIDSDLREVHGYASTAARDSQGEIVRLEALEAALPAYMRFANIREMHQPSAVGVAREAVVDGKGLWLKAHVVDDDAWLKVREGVYKGFSIGGLVTARDPADRHVITGVEITEISLVDRPANPETVFAVWKSADGKDKEGSVQATERLDEAALRHARQRLAQKWVASDGSAFARAEDAMRHEAALGAGAGAGDALAKTTYAPASEPTSGLTHYDLEGTGSHGAAADGPYADPGFQPDGKKRYPVGDETQIRAAWLFINHPDHQAKYTPDQLAHIKTTIIAAWKAKIDRDGPPAARGKAAGAGNLGKALAEAARLASLLEELEWLHDSVLLEDTIASGDAAGVPEDLKDSIAAMAAALRALIAAAGGDDDQEIERAVPSRRHGAAHERLQQIHDHAAALGAKCHGGGAEKFAGAELAKLARRNQALEDELGATLPLMREIKLLIEKVAAQPAVVPPSRLVAIDKGADVARELERIADQPPAVTAFELIRRAVREPLPFGARLK